MNSFTPYPCIQLQKKFFIIFFSILNEFTIIVIGLHAVFHRKKIVYISPSDFPLKLT